MKTNKGNTFVVIIIIIAVVAIGIWYKFGNKTGETTPDTQTSTETSAVNSSTAKINGKTITLLVADNEVERELGLGGRTSLGENEAMIFVFDKPDAYEFWMKDMKIPLDIIWLDSNYKVVHIAHNVTPETYPDETFAPEDPALYVLETNANFANKNNLRIGDVVEVSLKK